MSARTSVLEGLAENMRAALVAGDVTAARVIHETIGRLLSPDVASKGELAPVVDLASERRKRER